MNALVVLGFRLVGNGRGRRDRPLLVLSFGGLLLLLRVGQRHRVTWEGLGLVPDLVPLLRPQVPIVWLLLHAADFHLLVEFEQVRARRIIVGRRARAGALENTWPFLQKTCVVDDCTN